MSRNGFFYLSNLYLPGSIDTIVHIIKGKQTITIRHLLYRYFRNGIKKRLLFSYELQSKQIHLHSIVYARLILTATPLEYGARS